MMTKTLAAALVASLALASIAPAQAGGGGAPNPIVKSGNGGGGNGGGGNVTNRGGNRGGGNGAALAIGLIGGAIIGSAIANAQTRPTGRTHVGYATPRYVESYDEPRYVERRVVVDRYDYVPTCKKITIEDDYGNVTVKKSCR